MISSVRRKTQTIICRHHDYLFIGKPAVLRCLFSATPSNEASPSKLPLPTVDQLRIVALRAAIPVSLQVTNLDASYPPCSLHLMDNNHGHRYFR
jgi:hypothetical protein